MSVREDAAALYDDLVELRRSIHREPEIGLDLPRTQQKVLAALDGLPLEISTGRGLSSVIAVLRGGRPGPSVLLRGDMDALPVTELTGVAYSSQIDGAMHACGHDLHTAMLTGAARLLSVRSEDLSGSVIFMFQPGEEGCGGAKHMIDEGVLNAAGDDLIAAYALHVISTGMPGGSYRTRPGPILAAVDDLNVTVHGEGGHGSAPHHARDPIPVACEMVTALQTFVTRRFNVFDPVVVTVGSFHGGTANNVIPDEVRFATTVRSFSTEARSQVKEGLIKLVRTIAEAHGLSADIEYVDRYPVTVNDADHVAFATQTMTEMFGDERVSTMRDPFAGSEDFSYVLNEVPGAFVFLGACPSDRDPDAAPNNHSPRAVFDDSVLPDGAALYAELALRRLAMS